MELSPELFMVFIPGISSILFALGGTQISNTIKGWKGWRRFILPTVYFISVMIVAFWLRSLLVTGIAVLSYSMGYGEKHSWWIKTLIGVLYSIISIPLGISWWNLITLVVFLVLFKLSNMKFFAHIFIWKICEGIFGYIVGIQLSYILARGGGLIWF